MYFSCRVLHNNSWCIQGRQIHQGFSFGSIIYLSLCFYSFPHIHWSFWAVLLFAILQHKTSEFLIQLSPQSLIIEKKILGITYFHHTFQFDTKEFEFTELVFINNREKLKLAYEEWEMDEFGFELNSKYRVLGNIYNSALIFGALKEWFNVNFRS